ncbi:MAG: alpha/beta hydrolase [Ktedonobacteraceae bacterium]
MSEHKGKLEGKRITVANGLSMYTRASKDLVRADAPTVVLVHGLSVSSGYMMPTAVRLASSFHVYLPDLPGFGRSSKPSHILNVAELSDALASWMQTMKLPPATFLGNSMGCQIIVNLALRYPECIERAILVSPTMDPKARTIHQEAGRLLLDTPCEPLHFLPVLLREYMLAGIPRTIRTLQYTFDDPMEENLPHVHVPTLVIRGSRDPIVPQDWAEEVNRLLPNSQLVVVQGAGHAVNFNSPDRLVHLVRSFFQDTAQ